MAATAQAQATPQGARERTRLRFRQIHLDFHTSELVDGIGAQFDPEEFVRTLKQAASIPSPASHAAITGGFTTTRNSIQSGAIRT